MKALRSFLFLVAGLRALGCGTSEEALDAKQDAVTTKTNIAIADTYVMGDNSGGHGAEDGVVVSRYPSNNYRRIGFIKFSVHPETATFAQLNLLVRYYTGYGVDSANIRVYGIKDNLPGCQEAFSESGLVYNNVPFVDFAQADGIDSTSPCLTSSTPLATRTISAGDEGRTVAFASQAMTDFVSANTSAISAVTFVVTTDTLGPFISFYSKDYWDGRYGPKLMHSYRVTCSELQGDLQDGNLSLNLGWASLAQCDLHGANLSGANLNGADLNGANLRGANLTGVDLSHSDLRGADLTGADLRGSSLWAAQMTGANMSGTNLQYYWFSDTDLSGINFSGADFSHADLRRTNFSNGNLHNARLWFADLTGAITTGADRTNVQTYSTICPDGSYDWWHGDTCNGHW